MNEESSEDELTKLYSSVFRRNDPDIEQETQTVRIYEARYKIPKNANLGELMNAKSAVFSSDPQKFEKFAKDQISMGRYKRFTSYSTLVLMTIAFIVTIAMLIFNWSMLHEGRFFIARSRSTETVEIDYEFVNITKVRYFLYRNETEGATDIDDKSNYFIVDEPKDICQNDGLDQDFYVQQIEDLRRLTNIRDNIYSPFMVITEIYVILQMLVCAFLTLFWFPFKLKEYEIPIVLRKAKANVFFDFMRLKIMAYVYFLLMVGSLPHFMFYFPTDNCLHTKSEQDFGINWTDYYQYCLCMGTWIVSIPLVIFVVGTWLEDNFRFFMYPFLVANLVFLFGNGLLSFIVLFFALYRAHSIYISIIIAYDLFVLLWALLFNAIYEAKYANKDLLRNETEEVH